MKRYRVSLSPTAAINIQDAFNWFHAENPRFASKWRAEIRDAILGLATLPESHPVAPESANFDIEVRQILFGRGTPWRVFFTIDADTVHVLHVRHGSRDYWRS